MILINVILTVNFLLNYSLVSYCVVLLELYKTFIVRNVLIQENIMPVYNPLLEELFLEES